MTPNYFILIIALYFFLKCLLGSIWTTIGGGERKEGGGTKSNEIKHLWSNLIQP